MSTSRSPASSPSSPSPLLTAVAAGIAALAAACGGPGAPAAPGGTGSAAGALPGGSAAAGAGAGDRSSGPPTLSIARVDAAAECDGLVPTSVPAPVLASRDVPDGAACLGGTADGTGHLAVGARLASGAASWQAFAPDGAPLATFGGPRLDALAREPEGWQGTVAALDATGAIQRVDVLTVAPDGSERARTPVTPDPAAWTAFAWRVAEDPGGGVLVASGARTLGGNHWWSLRAVRVGPDGAIRASPAVADGPDGPWYLVAGVSVAGDAVAGWRQDGGEEMLQWLGAGGAPVGAALDDGSASALVAGGPLDVDLSTAPLLDGGVALRVGGAWRWTYPRLGTRAPAPAWLAARPGTTLRRTRGDRGYALLPAAGGAASPCTTTVELRAPSGRLCGTIAVRQGGASCAAPPVEQGRDGTLVVGSAADGCDAATGACTCSAWAWPRLLAAP